MRHRGFKCHGTMYISLILEMLHTKNGNNWLFFVKNVKLFTKYERWTTDDVQRPIAIGHLSDSGDLKIEQFVRFFIEFSLQVHVNVV